MLPRELPISDEAVMAAHEAYHARLATQKVDETYVAMPAAIQAFLQAEGFEVEHGEFHAAYSNRVELDESYGQCHDCDWKGPRRLTKDQAREDANDHSSAAGRKLRLVSPWHDDVPSPSSTEGGEGS